MPKYIALLRGINVGGHRKIRMDDLKAMFNAMGFEQVMTYIQSGNVIFDASENKPKVLSKSIEREIDETFGYDVPVIIRSSSELAEVLNRFPFEEHEGWKGYISFLAEEPKTGNRKKLEALSSDIEKFKVGNSELYSLIDKQAREKPLFSNNFVEKQLDMFATTRNLRTVHKILKMASST